MKEASGLIREMGIDKVKAENDAARPQLVRRLRRMQEVPGVSEVLLLSEAQRLQGIETPVEQMMARIPGGDD
jgi:hypothetical protein